MDPYGFSAAALMAAAQLAGTETTLAAPEVNGIDFSLAAIEPMMTRGLVTLEKVQVVRYKSYPEPT